MQRAGRSADSGHSTAHPAVLVGGEQHPRWEKPSFACISEEGGSSGGCAGSLGKLSGLRLAIHQAQSRGRKNAGLIFLMADCPWQRADWQGHFYGLLILCNCLPGGSKMSKMPVWGSVRPYHPEDHPLGDGDIQGRVVHRCCESSKDRVGGSPGVTALAGTLRRAALGRYGLRGRPTLPEVADNPLLPGVDCMNLQDP